MVPKIIHQSWKTKELDHWWFKKSQNSVKELYSNWEYKFWTDHDLEIFIKTEYPAYYNKWLGLDKKIKRIDVSRYFILHKFGGIYADLDFIFLKNIEELFTTSPLYFYQSQQSIVKGWDFLGNAFMASLPNQQFWLDLIEYMFLLPTSTHVLEHTGPRSIGKFYKENPQYDIHIFNPDIIDNDRCADGLGKHEYGYHMRTATWQHHPED